MTTADIGWFGASGVLGVLALATLTVVWVWEAISKKKHRFLENLAAGFVLLSCGLALLMGAVFAIAQILLAVPG